MRLNEKLAFYGGIVMIAGSLLSGLFENVVIRPYLYHDQQYTYNLKDLISYSADLVGQLMWVIALRRYAKFNKLVRCSCQWYIDLIVVDLVYVMFSNPCVIEGAKLIMMGAATVIFIIIYYIEYISLWHFNWWSKIKTYFNGTDKK